MDTTITLIPFSTSLGVFLREVHDGKVVHVHGPLHTGKGVQLETRRVEEETEVLHKNPTRRLRKTSKKQEDRIAKDVGGARQPASGALPHAKGDVRKVGSLRIEAKLTETKSYRVERSTLEKIEYEATPGELPCLVVDFIDKRTRCKTDSFVILRYETWLKHLGLQEGGDETNKY